MHGRKSGRKRFLGGLVTAGLQRAKRFREDGGLVLVARAGFFIPNGKHDRSHRGTTLLVLLLAGTGGANTMLKGSGHYCVKRCARCGLQAPCQARFYVLAKIA
jgi:hypothetical protein